MKKALITGISGQDGSYLAELLLSKGYNVYGTAYKVSTDAMWRIDSIKKDITVYKCDVRDEMCITEVVRTVKPDEIYHLASLVETRVSLEVEKEIFEVNFKGTQYLLQAIKTHAEKSKFFLAGSSLMFGDVESSPQNEQTPLRPNTPYGIAKTAGFCLTKMYREVHNIFACTGILYNHESPRRDIRFLPRKITATAANIAAGKERELVLGNIKAERDWGFAGDYVEAMWRMLSAKIPDDYVIGTGKIHSVENILEIAFDFFGLDWREHVRVDSSLFRKVDTTLLLADTRKIERKLKWKPKVLFKELIIKMVQADAIRVGL